MRAFTAAILLAVLAGDASAQAMRPVMTHETASKMREGCLAFARQNKMEVAIAVHDEAERLMTFTRMDGASTAVSDVALWKSRSAATFQYASAETAKWNAPTIPGIAVAGGGVPVFTAEGQPLGAIGVSGAATEQDIACGQAGIQAAGLRWTRP